jgi:hypothetical protein
MRVRASREERERDRQVELYCLGDIVMSSSSSISEPIERRGGGSLFWFFR